MIIELERALDLVAQDQVVAYPTETVYGLGVAAESAGAVARLIELKGRDADRGMSVLLTDAGALGDCVPDLHRNARNLARRYWPGPLTLVVPSADPRFANVASELGVGFRCSPHPVAAGLARGGALISTSCNRSGDAPCESVIEVEATFGADFPIVCGESAGGLDPSTVVAIDRIGRLKLLRFGPIPYPELEECVA